MDGTSPQDEHQFNIPSSARSLFRNEYTEAFESLEAHCTFLDKRISTLASQLGALEAALQNERTERKALEAELLATQSKSQASDDVQSQFLDNMSHELRTPLNGILGMTQLMLDMPLSKDLREYAESILQSGNLLNGIISNLLDYSRLVQDNFSGDFLLEINTFELLTALEEVITNHTDAALGKGVELNLHAEKSVLCAVDADQKRLQQIVGILLDNAIKFTDEGTVRVDVKLETPKAKSDSDTLFISIQDTGIGINTEQLALIYEPFWQADRSHSRTYGGVGMGLALCRELVSHLGGEVNIDSPAGQGTTFTVKLPVRRVGRPMLAEDQTEIQPLKIGLYGIEDVNKRILKEYLNWWGIEPEEITSSKGGSEAPANLDLIITAHNEKNQVFLRRLSPKQNGDAKTPLLVGITSPLNTLNVTEKNLYDILLTQPVLHQPLKEALSFAVETLKNSKAGIHVTPTRSPAHHSAEVLLIEPNKINQKILIHMLHSLGLQAEVVESLSNLPSHLIKKDYLATLINITLDPEPYTKVLHEIVGSFALRSSDKIIGIRGIQSDEPAQGYAEAGVSKILTLPTSIDQVKALLFGE